MTANKRHPRLLIEEWMPTGALGVECVRERSNLSALPPLNYLHVWWARRPLVVSRAAVLASLLPAEFDHATFERLLGFYGRSSEIIAAEDYLQQAKILGRRLPNPHGRRAFANPVPQSVIEEAHAGMRNMWGGLPTVLDPMAGGGTIPFEAARLGLDTIANEYNPVACSVLEATLDSIRFPASLVDSVRRWGKELLQRFTDEVAGFYPDSAGTGGQVVSYVYARTVPCPDTGAPTPLVSDWHLQKPTSGLRIVAEPIVDRDNLTWTVRMRELGTAAAQLKVAPKPTYNNGKAFSIYTGAVIESDYIKAMAAQGRLGSTLYAVVSRSANGVKFHVPEIHDLEAIGEAERELHRRLPNWERAGIIPTEGFPRVSSDPRPLQYGMPLWRDMFSPRQLLAMGVLVELLASLRPSILGAEGEERGAVVEHLLALAIDKFADRNCLMSTWETQRSSIAHAFEKHDFSFKSTWAEMAPCGAGSGLDWAIGNVAKAWRELASLPAADNRQPVQTTFGSALSLAHLQDGSVTAIVVDPPYADNVQYSELANFFYVWLKRTQGHRRPEWFGSYLSQHDQEAVVNVARMIPDYDPDKKYPTGTKKAAKGHSEQEYRRLMTAAFGEMKRVLRDDGVLTVMFTHKQQSAWEALFGSLIDAGFTITATWPIRTENPHSLHIAAKNAAESTVVLVARKRRDQGTGYFTLELRNEIRDAARRSAERLAAAGLNPIDQLVGSFGPAVEVFSRYETVRRDTGEEVLVGEALDEASDAVVEWRVERLMPTANHVGLAGADPVSRYVVMCWDVLAAAQFRFNEAKLLGHAVGLGPDDLVKSGVATKKSSNVILSPASDRRRDHPIRDGHEPTLAERKLVHPLDSGFRNAIDAAHALALEYADGGGGQNGIGAARRLALRQQWNDGSPVARLVEALVRAAPLGVRVEGKGVANMYAEFRAWHALLKPLFDIEPPDWSEQPILNPQLPGLTSALEADEEVLDDNESEDEDEGEERDD